MENYFFLKTFFIQLNIYNFKYFKVVKSTCKNPLKTLRIYANQQYSFLLTYFFSLSKLSIQYVWIVKMKKQKFHEMLFQEYL